MKTQSERLAMPWPQKLRTNERDKRGYPVPFIVMRGADGTPFFTVNDQRRVAECVSRKLCGLCGKRMREGFWFIGGERCFTDPRGAFLDPPSHEECARYAIQICPFLAAPNYAKRLDAKHIDPNQMPEESAIVVEENASTERPDLFGLGWTPRYEVIATRPGQVMFKAEAWRTLEIWRGGEQVVP